MVCKKCGSPIYYNSDYHSFMCYSCFEARLPCEPYDKVRDLLGNIGEVVCVHIYDDHNCDITVRYKNLSTVVYDIKSEGKLFYMLTE